MFSFVRPKILEQNFQNPCTCYVVTSIGNKLRSDKAVVPSKYFKDCANCASLGKSGE